MKVGKSGFSLIEMAIATGLIGLIGLGTMKISENTFKTQKDTEDALDLELVGHKLNSLRKQPLKGVSAFDGLIMPNYEESLDITTFPVVSHDGFSLEVDKFTDKKKELKVAGIKIINSTLDYDRAKTRLAGEGTEAYGIYKVEITYHIGSEEKYKIKTSELVFPLRVDVETREVVGLQNDVFTGTGEGDPVVTEACNTLGWNYNLTTGECKPPETYHDDSICEMFGGKVINAGEASTAQCDEMVVNKITSDSFCGIVETEVSKPSIPRGGHFPLLTKSVASLFRKVISNGCHRSFAGIECADGEYVVPDGSNGYKCLPVPGGGGGQCSNLTLSWENWKNEGTCSKTCGGGKVTQSRSIACSGPDCAKTECASLLGDKESKEVSCNTQSCSVYGSCSCTLSVRNSYTERPRRNRVDENGSCTCLNPEKKTVKASSYPKSGLSTYINDSNATVTKSKRVKVGCPRGKRHCYGTKATEKTYRVPASANFKSIMSSASSSISSGLCSSGTPKIIKSSLKWKDGHTHTARAGGYSTHSYEFIVNKYSCE